MTGLSLGELSRHLVPFGARLVGDSSVRVTDLRQDSRQVVPGDLFVVRDGLRTSGSVFVPDALGRGAVALLVDGRQPLPDVGAPCIEVDDLRRAAAFAVEALHGWPSRGLSIAGVTGTNGKTTTVGLATYLVNRAGGRAARLGTLGFAFDDQVDDSGLTTPEADAITRFAAQIRQRGATHLVMEVSSHALSLERVAALRFEVAAFTNLTQDHLDYHGSMEAYAAAKARLFREYSPRTSVINVDDPTGARLAAELGGRVLRVSRRGDGDVVPVEAELSARGIRGQVRLPSGTVEVTSRLVGEHNWDNLLLSLGIVEGLGLDTRAAAAAVNQAPFVPGRLERCDEPEDDVVALVDYAHTPDALSRALAAVRGLTTGRVICVFGCGGDRDPAKRPLMGEAVGRAADYAIVTNDNPRSEEPQKIAAAIEAGLRPTHVSYEVILERAQAIERAIVAARAGDVVLIAGKGHETYQIVGSERRAFDDRVEARRALALRRLERAG